MSDIDALLSDLLDSDDEKTVENVEEGSSAANGARQRVAGDLGSPGRPGPSERTTLATLPRRTEKEGVIETLAEEEGDSAGLQPWAATDEPLPDFEGVETASSLDLDELLGDELDGATAGTGAPPLAEGPLLLAGYSSRETHDAAPAPNDFAVGNGMPSGGATASEQPDEIEVAPLSHPTTPQAETPTGIPASFDDAPQSPGTPTRTAVEEVEPLGGSILEAGRALEARLTASDVGAVADLEGFKIDSETRDELLLSSMDIKVRILRHEWRPFSSRSRGAERR